MTATLLLCVECQIVILVQSIYCSQLSEYDRLPVLQGRLL